MSSPAKRTVMSATKSEPQTTEIAGVMTAEKKAEVIQDFKRSLEVGRKALVDGDLGEACDKLEHAAALSVMLFGYFAPETFEPHFYYGQALLELAETENESDESSLMDDSGAQEEMQLDTAQDKQQGETKNSEAVDVPMNESAEAKMDQGADIFKPEETAEFDPDQTLNDEDEEGDGEENELEVCESAFESLDYARLVCEKNSDGSALWLEREKDTFILLSKVNLEGGHLVTAVGDLFHALSIVEVHFPDNLVEASSVHLELARSYRLGNKFKEANFHIDKSIAAIQKFKENLQREPKEGTSLAEIDEIMEELVGEKQLIQVCEIELNELVKKQLAKIEDKPANTIQVKRTEKRAAGDGNESAVDFKKSKIGGASDIDQA